MCRVRTKYSPSFCYGFNDAIVGINQIFISRRLPICAKRSLLKSYGVTVGGLCGVGLHNEPKDEAEEMWRQYRLITEAVTSLQASSSAQRSDCSIAVCC